jgi:hypothetical protein
MHFDELAAAYEKKRIERNAFHDLMRYRVQEVLVVSSLFDSFVVESDGLLAEQTYGEYFQLDLGSVPRVSSAYDAESALELFREVRFDLVVIIAGLDFDAPLKTASAIKNEWPAVPVLLMVTNNTALAALDLERAELCSIDRVFVWNGYSKLFLGMVKLVEDMRNVEADAATGLVRVILLIEDSVRYYSRYLPLLFEVVQRQAQALIEEERGLEVNKLLRLRARPKVLLATSYEEAEALFLHYEKHILTVISDLRFPRGGRIENEAGRDFIRMAKSRIPDLPMLVQSSETSVRQAAYELGAAFVDKSSPSLEHELESFMRENLGFGPFVFRMPDGSVIAEAADLAEFSRLLASVPDESILFHASRNHFSTYLAARGRIRFAGMLKPYHIDDFKSVDEMRLFIIRLIEDSRKESHKSEIPYFDESSRPGEGNMTRLGDGSIGGKGRGIAFIDNLVEDAVSGSAGNALDLAIPWTAFIGIDEFERFLESNGLWAFAFYEAMGEEGWRSVREKFLATRLSAELEERLRRFALSTNSPLIVRSSGLFEDMLQSPFSGIYESYVIPNSHPDPELRARQLATAVKLVYASLFAPSTRENFALAGYALEEERMAVVVQELVGSRRGKWFYPLLSGTAQSRNYYPVSYLKPEDGLCIAALGLGSYVVSGGPALWFCPRFPKLDIVPPSLFLGTSQRFFLALDLSNDDPDLALGEDAALRLVPVEEAEADPLFGMIASTYDAANDRIVSGVGAEGPRVIDLANILKHDVWPLADVLSAVLELGEKSMGVPVEIEYAFEAAPPLPKPRLYLLQIKPLYRSEWKGPVDLDDIDRSDCFIFSPRSMGNGRDATIRDIVWVDPRCFDNCGASMNGAVVAEGEKPNYTYRLPQDVSRQIAGEIGELDRELRSEGLHYILVGPGRWGTRDPGLGIPVSFSQIAGARAVVEAGLPCFKVESSLGSHFFHNITSMNIGYLSVGWNDHDSGVDWEWLYGFPPRRRTEHCARTRLPQPIEIVMDGRSGRAAVLKNARAPTRARENED